MLSVRARVAEFDERVQQPSRGGARHVRAARDIGEVQRRMVAPAERRIDGARSEPVQFSRRLHAAADA